MAALRARSGVLAWLGALLLAFNLFAGAVLPVHSAKAADVAGFMEICTPDGMVWIDADGHRVKPEKQAPADIVCQFCLPMLHADISVPPVPTLPAPILRPAMAEFHAHGAAFTPNLRLATGQPRAPPAI